MAAHAHLKNEFTEDEKYSWDGSFYNDDFIYEINSAKLAQQKNNRKNGQVLIDSLIVLRLFNTIKVISSAVSYPIHTIPGQAS